jgi:cytochrome P450
LWHLRHHPLSACLALRARYGDVVRLPCRPHPIYLISHPDAVGYVLRHHARNYRKGSLFDAIAALQGQGLLTSEGSLWQRQRRLMQPVFHPRQLASLEHLVSAEASALVEGWGAASRSGQALNVTAWIHRFTFRVVGRALLGIAPEALDDLGLKLQALAADLMPYIASSGGPILGFFGWRPWPRRRRFQRAVAAYHDLVQQVIDNRRHALRQPGPAPSDLLARLIAACDSGAMSAQQLRDEVITFIGAGAETSAQALTWACYLLAQHPSEMQRLRQELDAVLGSRPPTLDDLPHLPYVQQVLNETLRLFPPSALLPRQANAADGIGGYDIPPHALILMSQYVTHRHPDFWPRPEHFEPQRFAPHRGRDQHRFAFFPFGAGPRACIGKSLAFLEMPLLLAAMAQRYDLRLVHERPVVPVLRATLGPRDGL